MNESMKIKLHKRVKRLTKATNSLKSAPISKLDKKMLRLSQIGLEVTLNRLMLVYNDISDKLGLNIQYKKEDVK